MHEAVEDPSGPVRVQETVPAGAAAPVIPVIVAVNLIVPPRTGEAGDDVTAISGVALPTVNEIGAVGTSAE